MHIVRGHKVDDIVTILLYLASNRGRESTSSDTEFLTVRIGKALHEYLAGDPKDFPASCEDKGFRSFTPAWFEDTFNDWLCKLLNERGQKINPGLRDFFIGMLKFSWVPKDGPSDGYLTNGIYEWWHGRVVFGHYSDNRGNFQWTVPEATEAEELFDELYGEMSDHCQQVADIMRKHGSLQRA